jgi:annexin A7/11
LEQRFIIANKYNELTGETLVGEIKTKFDCNFQKIMLALLTPLIDFYVQELNESLENYDHDSTIDIMCPLSNYEMYTLKYVYQKKYGIPLETEVRSKTSEHLKRLLLAICSCSRDETSITNLAAAQYDARQLVLQENPYDDEQFCYYKDIFSTRNFQQIKLISEEYQKITGQQLEKTIKSKFIMDDKQGYLCIVRYSQDKHGFFAKRLHRSMAGMGTNDNQLIRLVVTRCEIDLQDIKDTFQRNFGKSLRSWIKGDTSGHYKYCLYELIGEKRSNK